MSFRSRPAAAAGRLQALRKVAKAWRATGVTMSLLRAIVHASAMGVAATASPSCGNAPLPLNVCTSPLADARLDLFEDVSCMRKFQ